MYGGILFFLFILNVYEIGMNRVVFESGGGELF